MGRRYAELPPGDQEKEDLLLELCQCFHPYLMKYLVMIYRGHVPVVGHGSNPGFINKDVKPFLFYFLLKGQTGNYGNLSKVVRHLHLAFKGMETEEVYDVLMEQLLGAIKGYDPDYKAKVKLVVGIIDNEFKKRKQFTAVELNRHLEFDCNKYLKLLCRLGFLRKEGTEKVAACSRAAAWPPPAEFFKGSPIGLAYYLKFKRQAWNGIIVRPSDRGGELRSSQLGPRTAACPSRCPSPAPAASSRPARECQTGW